MAKKVEIEVDVKGEEKVKGLGQEIRELTKQLRQTPEGTKEWSQIYNKIDDLKDKLASSKNVSKDWIDTLEGAGGPLGMLGKGLNSAKVATQSFGAALKATGIGLIVAAIGMLVAAFTETEGSMKKLEPLMIMLEKLFGGLVEAFQPVLDAFLEVAMKVLPVFITGVKNFYGALMGLFTLVKEAGVGIGKILKGIFTLDTKSLEEGFDQIKGSWDKAKESFNQFGDNFDKGYAKQTKTQKENAAKSKEIADKLLADKLKRMEAEDKLDEATLNKMKAEAMVLATTEQQKLDVEEAFGKKSYELKKKELEDKQLLYKKGSVEYKGFTADLINLDAEYTKTKTSNAEKQKAIDDKKKEDEKKALEDFNNEMAQIKIDAITDQTKKLEAAENNRFEKQRSKLILDMLALGKTTEEMNQALVIIEQTHQDNINKIQNEAQLKREAIQKGDNDARFARIMAGATNDLDLQRQILEQKKLLDDEYYKKQLEQEGLTTEQIRELNDKKLSDQVLYTEKSNQIERDRIAVKQKALDDIISIAGAESEVGRAALIAKQIINAKELIMEITKTITFSTQAAARSVVAVAEGTAQTAKIGFPQNIPMLIGYAAQAVGIIAAIMSAVKSAKSSGSGGGDAGAGSAPAAPNLGKNYGDGGLLEGPRHAQGGVMINAEGGEAVMTRGAVTMFGPLLSNLNQMGGGTSFSKGATGGASLDNPARNNPAAAMEPMIMKTYVVSHELTTEAEKQAKLKDLSTL
jgi:hypothetical protein